MWGEGLFFAPPSSIGHCVLTFYIMTLFLRKAALIALWSIELLGVNAQRRTPYDYVDVSIQRYGKPAKLTVLASYWNYKRRRVTPETEVVRN